MRTHYVILTNVSRDKLVADGKDQAIQLRGAMSIAKEKYLHIRIEEELHQRLQEAAKAENRTLSNFILTVLQKELEKMEK